MKREITTLINLLKKRPIMAVWSLVETCNLDCSFCSAHKQERTKDTSGFDELLRTLKTLKKMGIRFLYLQGGEPLMRKDLNEIIEACLGHEMKPTVITNGYFLNPDFTNFIKDKDVNLSISLPTLSPAFFREFTGTDQLQRILSNIRSLGQSLKAAQHKGNWSITTTVTRANYREIPDIERFATENGFMYAIRSYIFDIGTFGKRDEKLIYGDIKDEILALFERYAEKERNRNFLAHLVYKEQLKFLRGNYSEPCDAIRRTIVVNSDSSFSPCVEHTHLRHKGEMKAVEAFLQKCRPAIERCYKETPCFHGCGRNIGVILNNKLEILMNTPRIISALKKHGSFF